MSRIAFLFIAFAFFPAKAFAEIEDWIPQPHHADLLSQGRDCAIYRSLATRARLTLEQTEDAELHFTELLKVRRADLAKCAEIRGFDLDGSSDADELAAEVCAGPFELWVRTGYRLKATREDRTGAQHSIDLLSANLQRYCARPVEVSPAGLRVR